MFQDSVVWRNKMATTHPDMICLFYGWYSMLFHEFGEFSIQCWCWRETEYRIMSWWPTESNEYLIHFINTLWLSTISIWSMRMYWDNRKPKMASTTIKMEQKGEENDRTKCNSFSKQQQQVYSSELYKSKRFCSFVRRFLPLLLGCCSVCTFCLLPLHTHMV